MSNRRSRFLFLFVLSTIFSFAIAASAFAAPQFTVFNKTYTRTNGKPQPVTDNFSVLNSQTQWLIRVTETQSHPDNDINFVIYLNGKEILKSHHCDSHSHAIEEKITLKPSNTLSVELRGKPGGKINVKIIGDDSSGPTAKWLNPSLGQFLSAADIPASLQLKEDISGLDPASLQILLDNVSVLSKFPVITKPTLSATLNATLPMMEGQHTLKAQIKNLAGLTTTGSVSFTVDRTPPIISALSPANGTTIGSTKTDISANYFDATSGIDLGSIHLKVDGNDVTQSAVVTASAITLSNFNLSDGSHTINLGIKDKVGFAATASSTFNVVSDPNYQDQDGDGYTPAAGDCNDHNFNIHPGANDMPGDGIDGNCDGVDTVVVPSVVGLTTTAAESVITGAQLKIGEVTSDNSETVPAGIIISQMPEAEDVVPQGTTVGFMISLGPAQNLPPDPVTVAPPIAPSGLTNFVDATKFLYTGTRPIQTGVQPEAMDPVRTVVLRGKVLNKTGSPLSGVTINILDHPELGETLSRVDGMFDLVVNGGGDLVVVYKKEGYLSSSRQMNTPWQDYVTLPEVVLIQADPQVTEVNLSLPAAFQVAKGSIMTDKDGSRQGTLLIPNGTQAYMRVPGQGSQPLNDLNIRITEYTVGPQGPAAMPAGLPATSAYTYAFDVNADEAVAAGATEIEFTKPVIYYVDNFIGFPAGTIAPLGYYNEKKGQWLPEESGKVIKILSVDNGLAQIDIDGTNQPATDEALLALGITTAERQQLASLYSPDKSLWRVEIPHFSSWDINWSVFPPIGAKSPDTEIASGDSIPCPNMKYGSVIECENQVLGESVDVAGTPFSLNYRSNRSSGYKSAYTTQINLSKTPIPESLKRIVLDISIAGRNFHQEFAPQNNLIVPFTWDGKDAYGRVLHQPQTAAIRIGYVYDAVYASTWAFGYSGNGQVITGGGGSGSGFNLREELVFWQTRSDVLGTWDARQEGLGGWTVNIHHIYDPISHVFFNGDGSRRQILNGQVLHGMVSDVIDGGYLPFIDVGPDGSAYVVEYLADSTGIIGIAVRRVYPDGTSKIVAGGGNPSNGNGDGGPATAAKLTLAGGGGLVVASDGTIYIAESYTGQLVGRVRRITPDGIISTVAGGVDPSNGMGDGGPATEASLLSITGLAVGADGSLYIADHGHAAVRKVDPDGIISTITGAVGPVALDVGPDGSVYFSDVLSPGNIPRIWRIFPSGIKIKVAAADCQPTEPDCFQFDNKEYAWGLIVAPDHSLYFSSSGVTHLSNFIYRLDNKVLTKIAGSGIDNRVWEGLASEVQMNPKALTFGPNGDIYFANASRMQKIAPAFPDFQVDDITVASVDGSELYVFDSSGHHLKTLSTLTGITLYQFGYTADGLSTITDRKGNVTRIERDGTGKPAAIVAPFGQRTLLRVDANGYLDKVIQPNGDTHQLATSSNGLLTQFIDPRNNTAKFTYDALGLLQKDENAAGGFWDLSRRNIDNGFEVTLKDALNRTTIYQTKTLDNGEEHRLTTSPDGTKDSLVIRPDYSFSSINADGTTVDVVRSADSRFGIQSPLINSQTARTPAGLTATMSTSRTTTLSNPNDILSVINQTESVNVNGKVYAAQYDVVAKTKTVRSPQGRTVVFNFDDSEHVVKEKLGPFEPVNYTYDSKGRLIRSSQGAGVEQRTLGLTYNSEGYLNDVTNSLNEKVIFEYDLKGRVIKQTLPDGRFITYAYDGNDNILSITPPGRPQHTFVYSQVDQVENYTPPVVSGGGQTTYLYNLAKQLKSITRPDGQVISYDYDFGGRLSKLTTPTGATTYSYDSVTGNLTKITAADNGTLQYTYDGSLPLSETWGGTVQGRVSQTYNNDFQIVSQSVNNSPVNFGYDNDGLLTQAGSLSISYEGLSGYLTGTTLGNTTTTFGYNSLGDLSSDTAKYGATNYLGHSYTYDQIGRILTRSETDQTQTDQYQYTYDNSGRLTDVKKNNVAVSHYDYDTNGNRLSAAISGATEAATYDAQDRLLTYGNFSYTYTSNGELKSKTNTATAQTTQYQYDVFGNLLQVTLPGQVIDYIIDGNDRRIGKKVNGNVVSGFLYEDALSPVAELDASNNVVSRFVYGTKMNVPDYMEKGGKTYRIITDHLGSVRMVVDISDGSVVQKIDYDEFGRVLTDTNPGFQPFGFAGGIYDTDTGLVRFGARDYDAFIGRWTAKDPIGFDGGDTNLYGYVINDPVNWKDLWGQTKIKTDGGPYYVHPNDADDLFPSNPHAHQGSPNSKIKVDLYTREIYKGTKKTGSKITEKALKAIWKKLPVVPIIIGALEVLNSESWADVTDPFFDPTDAGGGGYDLDSDGDGLNDAIDPYPFDPCK